VRIRYSKRKKKLYITLYLRPHLPRINPSNLYWIAGTVYLGIVAIHLSNGFGLLRSLTGVFTDVRLIIQCPGSFWDIINRSVLSESWGMLFDILVRVFNRENVNCNG